MNSKPESKPEKAEKPAGKRSKKDVVKSEGTPEETPEAVKAKLANAIDAKVTVRQLDQDGVPVRDKDGRFVNVTVPLEPEHILDFRLDHENRVARVVTVDGRKLSTVA